MSNIFSTRSSFKPREYEWAFNAYKEQSQVHWTPEEVLMEQDIRDWNNKLTPSEINLLTQIFRFFTQGDVDVAHGYMTKFGPLFAHKPEIAMMIATFASFEAIHIDAYSLLIETVGMKDVEYEAFREIEEMANKHEYVGQASDLTDVLIKKIEGKPFTPSDVQKIMQAVAVYAAFTEGLQLFSTFAILLNFSRHNKMKGMSQIVTWSIRDETLHVESMIKLFRTITEEYPEVWTEELRQGLYETCERMVELEDAFIDKAFEMGPMENLTADEVKQYIRYIADTRLSQLGLTRKYLIEKNPLPWVDFVINGVEHANFFETRATEYSKAALTGSWDNAFNTVNGK